MRRAHRLLLILLLAASAAPAITVQEIVSRSKHVLDGVNDFVCIMTFNVRSADMRVPDTRVRLYFKKPDRVKPEAIDKDFAVLPNTYHMAVGSVLDRLLDHNNARYIRDESLAGRPQWVLKLSPKESDTPILYHWVYVDQEQATVSRIATYPRQEKPATLNLTYQRWGKAWLPASATIDAYQKRKADEGVRWVPVTIRLGFSKYKVNVGLKDSQFD